MNVTPPNHGGIAIVTGDRQDAGSLPLVIDSSAVSPVGEKADDVSPPPLLKPFPRLRNILNDFVAFSEEGHSFHVLASVDISVFTEFAARCKREKRRPPSLVAYTARCVSIVLAKMPEIMAARLGNQLLIPGEVNMVVTLEAKTAAGDMIPLLVKIGAVDRKNLAEISAELTERSHFYKRNPQAIEEMLKGANRLARQPAWLRRVFYFAARRLPGAKRHLANFYTHVGLTSITHLSRHYGGWGLPILPFTTNMMLGGLSKRPVVVDDTVVARECLDITFRFDHAIVDGAPATRFMAAMVEEVESGRVLAEYLQESS